MSLCVITCYFNPCGYERLRENYRRFRAGMASDGVEVLTAELTFGRSAREIPDATMHVGGKDRNLLWQKERLLNMLLPHVPKDATAIAWIDADILFDNPDWPAATLAALQEHAIVQLYERSLTQMPDGTVEEYRPSCAWAYQHDREKWLQFGKYHPGFAWAARADWLRDYGLLDNNIVGGGDISILGCLTSDPVSAIGRPLNVQWKRANDRWAGPVSEAIGGRFGYVPGTIRHLWHGSHANRLYQQRWKWLTDNAYDPATDIEDDPENGLIRWTEHAQQNKPNMVNAVRGYFAMRREDDNPDGTAAREFTQDWFTHVEYIWQDILGGLEGEPIRYLEIGSFEGRSALWMAENVCTSRKSRIDCVDLWEDGEIEARFTRNVQGVRQIRKLKGWSHVVMRKLGLREYDVIYIDGGHEGINVIEDAVHAFRLLKVGGLMCFDDYEWDSAFEGPKHVMPNVSIDSFLGIYAHKIEVVHKGYQVWVRRLEP